MFKIALICALLSLAAGHPGKPITGRIIGGSQTTLGQFPALVSLQNKSNRQHFCGGGLVSTRLIVTAGHCFYGNTNPANSVVFVGSNDLGSNQGTTYELQRVLIHPDFDYFELTNDITLLQTKEAVALGPNVATLKLPAADLTIPTDTPVIALGWGTIAYPNQNYPNIANYVQLGVVDNRSCQNRLQSTILDNQICVGGVDGKGLCFGDSGSPLILNGDTTVGIVSWGNPCGIGYPDVFTRVSSFVEWVNANSALLESLEV